MALKFIQKGLSEKVDFCTLHYRLTIKMEVQLKLLIYARLNQGISNEPIYFDEINLILFRVVFKNDGLWSFHIKLDGNIFF